MLTPAWRGGAGEEMILPAKLRYQKGRTTLYKSKSAAFKYFYGIFKVKSRNFAC
jgi:hypothetical protein